MNIGLTKSFIPALLLVLYVATSCLGLYLIKAAPTWKSVTFGMGFFLYASGAAMWLVILRLLPLSLAFPIAAGALVIGTLLTGAFFLDEHVSALHASAAALIVTGNAMIALKS